MGFPEKARRTEPRCGQGHPGILVMSGSSSMTERERLGNEYLTSEMVLPVATETHPILCAADVAGRHNTSAIAMAVSRNREGK